MRSVKGQHSSETEKIAFFRAKEKFWQKEFEVQHMQREVEHQLQQRASLSSEILNGGRALVDNHQTALKQLNHRTSSQQQTSLTTTVTTALDDSITSEMNDN